MTDYRAWLFVDVDGVLNAFGPFDDERRVRWAGGFGIVYVPGLGQKIIDLAARHDAQLAWLTTWQDRANEYISPLLGLPADLPVVHLPPVPRDERGRALSTIAEDKVKGLELFLDREGYRPFVWLDDEEDAHDALHAAQLDAYGSAVQVDPRVGLTGKDLDRADVALTWLIDEDDLGLAADVRDDTAPASVVGERYEDEDELAEPPAGLPE